MKVYPIFLNRLNEKKTVIIGGNREAERKAGELLQRDANITIINPTVTDLLLHHANSGKIRWIKRNFQEGDLDGAFLVIVAEYHDDTNERVYKEAENKSILVNVMDDAAHCTFTFGSIVNRGNLNISISTSGAAPALAVRLRQRFEREFGEEYEQFLNFTKSLRKPMSRHYSTFSERKKLWYELIDSDILELLEQNRPKEAYERATEIIGETVVDEVLDSEKILSK